ncbi:MAG: hypothetical protein LBI13_00940 [Streptococcaceae bacterium]|jgi:hypothetical protein|nr:hypothetical protein [Streptococcaceae bacterium]
MKLRGIVSLVMAVLLSLIIVGSMSEVGQIIRYPASTKMTITEFLGKNKVETFNEINKLAKESGIIIYKPLVTDDGSPVTGKLGVEQARISEIKNRTLTGDYYLSHDSDQFRQGIATMSVLKVNYLRLSPFVFPLFLFSQSANAPSVWILLAVFFVSVYAVEMAYVKKGMIYRSLGRLSNYLLRNILVYSTFLFVIGGVIIGIFALSQASVDSVYVIGFAISFGISIFLLMLLSFFANILFAFVLKTHPVVSILKNRYVNRFGGAVYMISILLSMIIFTLSINASIKTAIHLRDYNQSISKWKSIKNYVLPSFDDGEGLNVDANHMLNQEYLVNQIKSELNFNQSFSDGDFIFARASAFDKNMEKYYLEAAANPESRIAQVKTDSSLSSQIMYVSRGFILMNEKLFPKNSFGETNSSKLITIYIPKSLKKYTQSIENNVIAETFPVVTSGVSSGDFNLSIIPDNQEVFLFDFNPGRTPFMAGNLPKQTARNKILVQVNYKKLSSLTDNVAGLMGGNTTPYGTALIYKKELLKKLNENNLQNQLVSVDNISADVEQLSKTVTTELQGTIIVMISVILSSLFILWKYLGNLYLRFSKVLVIHSLFGGNEIWQEIKILSPILFGSFISAGISGYLTGNWFLCAIIFALYVVEILVVVLMNKWHIREKRVQIVKDSLE